MAERRPAPEIQGRGRRLHALLHARGPGQALRARLRVLPDAGLGMELHRHLLGDLADYRGGADADRVRAQIALGLRPAHRPQSALRPLHAHPPGHGVHRGAPPAGELHPPLPAGVLLEHSVDPHADLHREHLLRRRGLGVPQRSQGGAARLRGVPHRRGSRGEGRQCAYGCPVAVHGPHGRDGLGRHVRADDGVLRMVLGRDVFLLRLVHVLRGAQHCDRPLRRQRDGALGGRAARKEAGQRDADVQGPRPRQLSPDHHQRDPRRDQLGRGAELLQVDRPPFERGQDLVPASGRQRHRRARLQRVRRRVHHASRTRAVHRPRPGAPGAQALRGRPRPRPWPPAAPGRGPGLPDPLRLEAPRALCPPASLP
mmetsp:Transcript_15840/g.47509  ORF Transcript_15840/g.47509 Transcript_15840/m.47509 type:complete len:370 (+) Transcript_15840:1018-2127(+)